MLLCSGASQLCQYHFKFWSATFIVQIHHYRKVKKYFSGCIYKTFFKVFIYSILLINHPLIEHILLLVSVFASVWWDSGLLFKNTFDQYWQRYCSNRATESILVKGLYVISGGVGLKNHWFFHPCTRLSGFLVCLCFFISVMTENCRIFWDAVHYATMTKEKVTLTVLSSFV